MSRSKHPAPPTGPADSPDAAERTPHRRAVRSRYRPPFPGPILRLPAGRFRPRHCPYIECRFYHFAVWRNAAEWRRENHPSETEAMKARMVKRRLRWAEVFARRRFPRERELPGSWWKYYWRQVKTAALGDRQTENNAHFAF